MSQPERAAPPVSPAHVVRLNAPGGYCSGSLIGPSTVLTCAHFFQPHGTTTPLWCHLGNQRRSVASVDIVAGRDIAFATLTAPFDQRHGYPDFSPPPALFTPTVTFGFGGRSTQPVARVGRYLGALPFAFSRSFATVVRPAGFIFNTPPAIKGDSGGPVVAHGRVIGIQSLILDPFGLNLAIATVSLVGPGDVDTNAVI